MSWRWVPRPISFKLSSRSSANKSLRNSSMTVPSGSTGAALRGGRQNRVDDRLVAGAAADVAADSLDHVVAGRRRVVVEQRLGGHQHARGAEAALRGKMLHEGALQWVQVRAVL